MDRLYSRSNMCSRIAAVVRLFSCLFAVLLVSQSAFGKYPPPLTTASNRAPQRDLSYEDVPAPKSPVRRTPPQQQPIATYPADPVYAPTHQSIPTGEVFEQQVPWWHNGSVFGGLDGSKQPQDFGVNAHFGGRVGGNLGVSLLDDEGLGAQIGLGFNFSDNAVKVLEVVGEAEHRNQLFLTTGIFQRTDSGLVWAAAYDFLWQDYYSNTSLGQFRGLLGLELNDCDEVGVWGTLRGHTDDATVAGVPIELNSIDMINAYWKHRWEFGAETMFWVGVTGGHGEEVLLLGKQSPVENSFVFGAAINLPLNESWAITGQANFLLPADTGTVDSFLGLTHFFGGARTTKQTGRFRPVLPVANNSYFPVDLSR